MLFPLHATIGRRTEVTLLACSLDPSGRLRTLAEIELRLHRSRGRRITHARLPVHRSNLTENVVAELSSPLAVLAALLRLCRRLAHAARRLVQTSAVLGCARNGEPDKPVGDRPDWPPRRAAGHDARAISQQTGHKPGSASLFAYLRVVDQWTDNAVVVVGL